MKEKLITTREVSHMLKLSEKEVIDHARSGLIPSLKVGGEFLRFRQQDIMKIRQDIHRKYKLPHPKTDTSRAIKEFVYFNDFYIIAAAVIVVLLWIIVKDFYS